MSPSGTTHSGYSMSSCTGPRICITQIYVDSVQVLRAVRFASRFHFTLDAELIDAASSAQVRAAIHDKVSRERIYKECEGCLSKENCRPYRAFVLIHR
jgi:tRNA nucleotidyltransferase/poly(A) polymerase